MSTAWTTCPACGGSRVPRNYIGDVIGAVCMCQFSRNQRIVAPLNFGDDLMRIIADRDRLRAEVETLRADAAKKDGLLARAYDMLDYVGCSPEGASKDIKMAETLKRDIDAARAAQGERG